MSSKVSSKGSKSGYKVLIIFLLFSFFDIKTVVYLFSHGFADTGKQFRKYVKEYKSRRGKIKKNKFYIIDGAIKTFNYPDAICKPFSNLFRTSLGQENELQALIKAYQQAVNMQKNKEKEIKEDGVVLVGVSRGASAAAIFMGAYRPKNVKAVILISPFAHVYDVFKTNFFYKLFVKISCYSREGKHPINWLCNMDRDIPILFVCSKTDKTVPCNSTIRLYKKLVLSGHKDAYLLCLQSGKHAKLLKSQEAQKFQNVVHAFYKKYNLPCNNEFANNGTSYLNNCKWKPKSCDMPFDYDKEQIYACQKQLCLSLLAKVGLRLTGLRLAGLRLFDCQVHSN